MKMVDAIIDESKYSYFYVYLSRQVVDVEVDAKIYLTQKLIIDESNLSQIIILTWTSSAK